MFNSRGKHTKVVNVTSVALENEDIEEQLSHNSRKRQNKFDGQATEITTIKTKLNKALEENKKLKDLYSPEKMVVSKMTM